MAANVSNPAATDRLQLNAKSDLIGHSLPVAQRWGTPPPELGSRSGRLYLPLNQRTNIYAREGSRVFRILAPDIEFLLRHAERRWRCSRRDSGGRWQEPVPGGDQDLSGPQACVVPRGADRRYELAFAHS